MANKLTKANLVEEMLIKLEAFNKKNLVLDGETVHSDLLSNESVSKRRLYIGAMRWTIWANGGKDVKFPANWLTLSVNDLAEYIMTKQLS